MKQRYPIGSKIIIPCDPDDDDSDGYGIIDEYRGTDEYHITFDDGSERWYDESHYSVIGDMYKVIPPNPLPEELFNI